MNDDATARLGLPTIRPGQAQKESSHNEALTLIDLVAQAGAVAFGTNAPPAAPVTGQAWVIGPAAAGAWAGRAGQLAGWTDGGWRFVVPFEGLAVWIEEAAEIARYSGGGWVLGELRGARVTIGGVQVLGGRRAAIAGPAGGGTIDAEARAAIAAILAALRGHGLIET
ncbi:hypothetical protein ASG11_04135 [Sphingomonas sp. Leaf357]|uniref:DUF2793 domain-containing protein n=1 Tax=Sphingomonas sp. Leaf357 TaxID=1736350 RepID=UPI0006FA30FB|nr:DUF2793 domain-containing protein [Sphingomonas sp. Leaf357]KQS03544.1 hypothetical protein ASG11_04135 [Sphingomonas sp. Leaf357]